MVRKRRENPKLSEARKPPQGTGNEKASTGNTPYLGERNVRKNNAFAKTSRSGQRRGEDFHHRQERQSGTLRRKETTGDTEKKQGKKAEAYR